MISSYLCIYVCIICRRSLGVVHTDNTISEDAVGGKIVETFDYKDTFLDSAHVLEVSAS